MTFTAGNYNDFENFATVELPSTCDLIRYTILPRIESTLKDMLGDLEGIKGSSINVSQLVNIKEGLSGLHCSIVYDVGYFKVPEAPIEAINEDTETLTKALSIEDAHLKKVSIDTKDGSLVIEYVIPIRTAIRVIEDNPYKKEVAR